MLTDYFTSIAFFDRGDVFIMRGTEGETVANVKRAQQIDWFCKGGRTTLVEKQEPNDALPNLPDIDAQSTADWIKMVLRGEIEVPTSIEQQVRHCLAVSKQLAF